VDGSEIVVKCRRGRLILQGAALLVPGGALGFLLQSCTAVATSRAGRLGENLGVPLVAIIVVALASVVAVTLLRDSWAHEIVVGATQLSVSDKLGSFTVPYIEIERVCAVPLGGVAIAFRNTDAWLDRLDAGKEVRSRTAQVLRRAYDCFILFPEKVLSVGSDRFLELLRERCDHL